MSNTFANGVGDDVVEFDKPINYLNVYVDEGTSFSFSLDRGLNFMRLPSGFHSFRVGSVKKVRIHSDGEWELMGVQS